MTIFKNEQKIKEMIMDGKRRGICNGEGKTVVKNKIPVARARFSPFVGKTYIIRKGKIVEK